MDGVREAGPGRSVAKGGAGLTDTASGKRVYGCGMPRMRVSAVSLNGVKASAVAEMKWMERELSCEENEQVQEIAKVICPASLDKALLTKHSSSEVA